MKLSPLMLATLRQIAKCKEPVDWNVPISTARALEARDLVTVATHRYSGTYNRFGMPTMRPGARVTHWVDVGATITAKGRAVLAAQE